MTNLTALAAIGNFVSGIAVVFSFLFLALQIRQANRNQRSLMQHGRTERVVELLMRYSDPELADVVLRTFRGDVGLNDAEYFAFYAVAGSLFWTYEDSYLQFRGGTLDTESWESDRLTLSGLLTNPAYRAAWRASRENIGGEYRDFVDSLMRETRPKPSRDIAAVMRKYITEEMAEAKAAATTPT